MANKNVATAFDTRSSFMKGKVVKMYENQGDKKVFVGGSDSEGFDVAIPSESQGNGMTMKQAMLADMQAFVKQNEYIRRGSELLTERRGGVEYSLAQAVADRYGFSSVDDWFRFALDIDPTTATLASFNQISDIPEGYRWLIPEIILEMYKLGLNLDPIYQRLISADIPISQPRAIIPFMNVSDAMAKVIGSRESVELGQMSFGKKDVSVVKFGIGIEMDSEIINAVSINLLSHFMQDAGTKFNTALDALALMTLMNGEQADGSCSAATIGVRSVANGFTYRDYKHITKRMERMGRRDMIMIAGEDASVDIELLPEFLGGNYQTRIVNIGNQSRTQELITHGIIPDKKVMFVDKMAALLKLTYQGMSIETERYARTDISAAYVRCSTGFATKFRDARLIVDTTKDYATNGFPTWIDPTTVEKSFFGKRGNV